MRTKLSLSLSRLVENTVGVGLGLKTRNGRYSRATRGSNIEEETEAVATPSTLLLYGAQSVHNGTCNLTCLCAVCAHRVRWEDG